MIQNSNSYDPYFSQYYWLFIILGAIGSLQSGISDFAIGHFLLTLDFLPGVKSSSSLYPMDVKLITPFPKPFKPYINMMNPFSNGVWTVLFATFGIISFVYGLTVSFNRRDGSDLSKQLFFDSAIQIFRVMCSQSKLLIINTI